MAKSGFRWVNPPSRAWKAGIAIYVLRVDMAIGELLSFWAPQIEATMKRNAIWIDRTGNARQTLSAFAYRRQKGLWVLVAQQYMSYGVYLEGWNPKTNTAMVRGRKYAIVLRSLHAYYPRIWGSLGDMLK